MNKAIQELKIQAKKRHRSLLAGDQHVFERLRRRFPKADEFKLKHSLHLIAYEKGFADWPMALRYLSGREQEDVECGSFWYSQRCASLLNHWFASYDEAKQLLGEHKQHILVPFRNQFIVADHNYLAAIGFSEEDHETWHLISSDLVEGYGTSHWETLVWQRLSMTI